MKKRDIEKSLRESLAKNTPNVLDRVLASPVTAPEPLPAETPAPPASEVRRPARKRSRRPLVAALSVCMAAVLVAVGVTVGLRPWGRPGDGGAIVLENGGSVYLDINPSVQLVLDAAGKVTAAVPLNEDARVLLKNRERELKGLAAEQAASLVVRYAGEQGYIRVDKKTNAVLVSAALEDAGSEKKLEKKVAAEIQGQFEAKGIYGVVVTDAKDKSVSDKAAALGVTESKMRLVENVRALGVEISDERAKTISVADLYDLFEEASERMADVLDDDVLEDKLEELEEKSEQALEALEDRVGLLVDDLKEYLEDNEADEAVQDALDALEGALEQLLDEEDRGDAVAGMRLVRDAAAGLAALSLSDAALAEKIESFTAALETVLEDFTALEAELEAAQAEAVRLLTAQQENLAASKAAFDAHAKSGDFDKEYEKWLRKAQREYENDWDGMKRKWEEDD